MSACRQRQQWAALNRSCLLSVLVKSDAIGGLIECKRLVKCNANEWSVPMQSDGQVECNFAQRAWQEDFHADVESAISTLADIAPRIDKAALNESYRTTLLVDVRATKRLLSACLEKELKEFDRYVGVQCEQLTKSLYNGQFSNAFIGNIAYLGEAKIFQYWVFFLFVSCLRLFFLESSLKV